MPDAFDMILEKIEEFPDKTAFWTETGSFTFRELYDYSLRAAYMMQKDGVSKGDFVTIELPRCREYIGFMLGTWMLGAAFVPSDNSYPEDSQSYIAKDCGDTLRIDPE